MRIVRVYWNYNRATVIWSPSSLPPSEIMNRSLEMLTDISRKSSNYEIANYKPEEPNRNETLSLIVWSSHQCRIWAPLESTNGKTRLENLPLHEQWNLTMKKIQLVRKVSDKLRNSKVRFQITHLSPLLNRKGSIRFLINTSRRMKGIKARRMISL